MTRKVFQADFGSQADQMVLSAATNPIHNGGFNVWQRGTTFTSVLVGAYTADRWKYFTTSAAVHDILRSTDVPSVAALVPLANYSMHLDVTTADAAIAAGDTCWLYQLIEGYAWAPFAQQILTLGFWVKDTITGIHCVALRNTGGDRSCVMEYTVNVADTWEYKTVTFPASPSAGTWDYTTGIGTYLVFPLAIGATFQTTAGAWQAGAFYATPSIVNSVSSTSNNFKLWGVTMGLGTTVAPFWPRSFGEELALCQRYYWKSFPYATAPAQSAGTGGSLGYQVGVAGGGNLGSLNVRYPVPMRASPTLTFYSPSNASANFWNGNDAAVSGAPIAAYGAETGVLLVNPQVAGDGLGETISVHMTASADL